MSGSHGKDKAKKRKKESVANNSESRNEPCEDLIPRPARDFPVEYRRNPMLKKNEQDRIQRAVEDGGIAVDTQTYIRRDKIPTLLNTDYKGAAKAILNAPREDVKR